MSPDEFWALEPREFWIKHDAFVRAENRKLWLLAKLATDTTEYKTKFRSPDHFLGYEGSAVPRYPEKPWLKP